MRLHRGSVLKGLIEVLGLRPVENDRIVDLKFKVGTCRNWAVNIAPRACLWHLPLVVIICLK